MERITSNEPELEKSLLSMVLGFVGVTAIILLLPKTLKFMIRRFVFGLVGEIVLVVLSGLLTEKAVSWLGHDHAQANGRAHPADSRQASIPQR